MKKNYLLSMTALLTFSLCNLQAQVVNGNFENIKQNGMISNWGMNFAFPVSIDVETGQTSQDVITFGCWPGFVFPSFDARQGQYAMQITNGLNLSSNEVIPGKSIVFNDPKADFPGWNPGVPVNAGENLSMLGFYYKFFPMGNDVAEAELVVFGVDGEELGRASADISEVASQYQYLYTPVQFTASGTPTFMHISFSMAKEGSTPNFGSTLMIDGVFLNFQALANNEFDVTQFAVFPTKAQNEINIVKGATLESGQYDFSITNIEGRTVSNHSVQLIDNNPVAIDVSQLAKGIYIISSKGYSTKFVKE